MMRMARQILHYLMVLIGAVLLTLAFFLVLPIMQKLGESPNPDLQIQSIDTANIPPPPPPIEEEPEPEPEPEEAPPELAENQQMLDLSQLELALNPGFGGAGGFAGDFNVKLNTVAGGQDLDALFSLSDLDQKPRALHQPGPTFTAKLRRKAPGTVYVLFVVNQAGRVEDPIVQKSSNPAFNQPALAAVKRWKFEPGKRNGKPVRFRMRVPITFPEE